MNQHQLLYSSLLSHARRSGGAALTGGFSTLVHDLLIVPTHAQQHVGALGQIDNALAGLGITGEHHAAVGRVHPVGQGIQLGLDMLSIGRGHLPVAAAVNRPNPYILRVH